MIYIDKLSFSYGEEDSCLGGVRDISLNIARGECVVLCGQSGCGKTTLTRLINGLIPHFYEGNLKGKVIVDGEDVSNQALSHTARKIGSVFQNPRSQFFNVDTTSELAFGCENIGLPVDEIFRRIEESASTLDIEDLLDRSIFELSGGEKQRIACASVYAVKPDIFVLDEPSSNLDAVSIEKLRKVLDSLKRAGKTIVISEHRLYYLSELADRYIYMKDGRIECEIFSQTMKKFDNQTLNDMGLRCLILEKLDKYQTDSIKPSDDKINIKNLDCRYDGKTVLQIPFLSVAKGEILAVIGHNGAGKSTFAGCLCGIIKHKGDFSFEGKILKAKKRTENSYMVMQDVNHQLFTESVSEELSLGALDCSEEKINEILEKLKLDIYSDTHPLALSGGQKQRVAIAGAMCSNKKLLIYDEPTSGLDYNSMKSTCSLIREAAKDTYLSVIITHDLEFILECCTAVLQLCDGKITDYYPLDKKGVNKVKEYFIVK